MLQVADLHCDTIIKVQAGVDLTALPPRAEVTLPAMERGGVGLQVMACFVSSVLPEDRAVSESLLLLELISEVSRRHGDRLQLADTAADVEQAWAAGRIAIVPAVENGHAIGSDLGNLERLRRSGARSMTLTHSAHLPWAASSGQPYEGQNGLTPFGEEVVATMNDLGMIIDISHVHETTFWDVIRCTKRPVFASHSCAAALCPIPRNLTDDQIRAVADSGGMVGINFFPGFLHQPYWELLIESCGDLFKSLDKLELEKMNDPADRVKGFRRFGDELEQRMAPVPVGLERVADHVAHVMSLVGDEHVGFGSDFDGIPTLPDGIDGSGSFPSILDALRRRGFDEQSVERIASGNFLRILG